MLERWSRSTHWCRAESEQKVCAEEDQWLRGWWWGEGGTDTEAQGRIQDASGS